MDRVKAKSWMLDLENLVRTKNSGVGSSTGQLTGRLRSYKLKMSPIKKVTQMGGLLTTCDTGDHGA